MYTRSIPNRRLLTNDYVNSTGALVRSVTDLVLDGTQTGSKVENYRSKIASGQQAGSAFFCDKYTEASFDIATASLSYADSSTPWNLRHSTFSGVYQPAGQVAHLVFPTSDMNSSALSRMYSKIRSEKTSVNGMNILGEMRETIGMLRSPFKAMRVAVDRHLLSLENSKKSVLRLPVHKRRAEWEKAVAGTTLELNFGLKPLISDSKAIAEAIAKVVVNGPKRSRLVTRGEETRSSISDPSTSVLPNSTRFVVRRTYKVTTVRRIQYICGMEYAEKCAVGALNRLREQLGFTAENFVPTIYELMPWSWLVDYFTNVGEILEAATTDTSAVQWITRTETAITTAEQSADYSPDQAVNLDTFGYVLRGAQGSFGKSKIVRRSVNRSLPSTLGIPGLTLTHPGESFSKVANMLSVLAQRRKGLQDLSYMPTYYERKLAR